MKEFENQWKNEKFTLKEVKNKFPNNSMQNQIFSGRVIVFSTSTDETIASYRYERGSWSGENTILIKEKLED